MGYAQRHASSAQTGSAPARETGDLKTTVMLDLAFGGRCRLLQIGCVALVRARNGFITLQLPVPPRCESVATCSTRRERNLGIHQPRTPHHAVDHQ